MNTAEIIQFLELLGKSVCRKVHSILLNEDLEALSQVHHEGADDTIYKIDQEVEETIVKMVGEYDARLGGITLVAEGIYNHDENKKKTIKLIIDPIDGTRGLMFNKRSAFFLAGVAPDKGNDTSLQDIEIAIMVELPTSRSFLSDILWAEKGKGANRKTWNLLNETEEVKQLRPSKVESIFGGFAQFSRFFSPGKEVLAAIEETMLNSIFPDAPEGKIVTFEDQYISSGGQLYELLVGHDRFVADIRMSLYSKFKKEGKKAGHVCHPYDLCAHLIGTEAGIIITDINGNPLDATLDTESAVEWIGYANEAIKRQVQPALVQALKVHHILQ